jgi:hypothetical protein
MKKINQWLLISFFISALVACKPKPIDIHVKPAPPKIVVASSVLADNFILVFLSRNFSSFESKANSDSLSEQFFDKVAIKNAFVTITHKNITDTLFQLGDGFYGSINLGFEAYDDYSLYAMDLESGQEVTATTNLLPFYQFDVLNPYKVVNGKDTACRVNYELSDDLTRENYYVVNYIRKDESKKGKKVDVNKLFSGKGASTETDFDLLKDDSFTDGKYKVDKILKDVRPTDSLAISVSSISKGYYEFLTVFKRSGTLINTLTSEPLSYPTNVKNGYGYFNAYTPQILFIDMKAY